MNAFTRKGEFACIHFIILFGIAQIVFIANASLLLGKMKNFVTKMYDAVHLRL